jgi:hypothetical protein
MSIISSRYRIQKLVKPNVEWIFNGRMTIAASKQSGPTGMLVLGEKPSGRITASVKRDKNVPMCSIRGGCKGLTLM